MVSVIGAPGYADFEADLIMEVPSATGEPMSVVGDPDTKEIFVIPAKHVHYNETGMDCE